MASLSATLPEGLLAPFFKKVRICHAFVTRTAENAFMNSWDPSLIRESFGAVMPNFDRFSIAFYKRLFAGNPEVRSLFAEDLAEQRRKLVQMLAMMVHRLEDVETLQPMLKNLGQRHVAYGAKIEHYEAVKNALLGALQDSLGEDYDERVDASWTELLDWVSDQMKEGAAAAAH